MKRRIIAVTGPIGSGKSTVVKMLQNMGYTTLNCDQISRQVATDPQVIEEVRQLLGEKAVADGQLDRKYIRQTVFADDNIMQRYNQLFWGRIRDRLVEQIEKTTQHVFVEIAMVDAFPFPWDLIWCVTCLPEQSVQRVTKRDGVEEKNVQDILAQQNKSHRCHRVIANYDGLQQLQINLDLALREAELFVDDQKYVL